ncbi:pseudouridine synthase, partial [Nocardia sp. NPDC059764]|uniref:pseudouridine synthase n=1 Tax=Nocardia sp. NPDC059764 TaxID=3346939 RepID=UPI0036630A92
AGSYGRDSDRSRGGAGSYGRDSDRSRGGAGSYGRDSDRSRGGAGSYGRDSDRSRGGSAPRGESQWGASGSRGGAPARGGSGSGFGGQGGNSARGNQSRGIGGGRPLAPHTSPNTTGKKKTSKPERKIVAPVLISNAKPARHQHVDFEERAPKKLPWGEGERLQKVLAKAGVASRRVAEDMIDAGRIEVDGKIVREQGLRIDPETAVVRVDGVRVVIRSEQVYLALNKPKGWQSTMSDEMGRPCVGDIVAERIAAGQRLFHVGRLDADTEGLLLLTNDGDLAHRLMHPSFEVSKTYLATVNGEVRNREVGKQLKDGVELEDGPASVDKFQVLEVGNGKSLVKVVLHEGRKHIVRRLLDAVGHPVTALVRTHVGPIALGDQRPGTLRVLGRDEVGKLYEAVSL